MPGIATLSRYRPTPFDEYVRYERWRSDPNLSGRGIGLLIVERRGTWTVRRVLKGSPADKAGLEPGALLHAINNYDMQRDVDIPELQMIVKSQTEDWVVSHETRGALVRLAIRPTWLRGIIGRDIGLDGGGFCNTCKRCYSTTNGFETCGDSGCSGRCAVI